MASKLTIQLVLSEWVEAQSKDGVKSQYPEAYKAGEAVWNHKRKDKVFTEASYDEIRNVLDEVTRGGIPEIDKANEIISEIDQQQDDLESKSLNSEQLKQLLRDLDDKEIRSEEGRKREIERLQKIRAYKGVNVEEAIEKKIEIQKKYEENLKTAHADWSEEEIAEKADLLSDTEIVIKEKLIEDNQIEVREAERLTKKIIQEVIRPELVDKKGQSIEPVEKNIKAIVKTEPLLKSSVLLSTGIVDQVVDASSILATENFKQAEAIRLSEIVYQKLDIGQDDNETRQKIFVEIEKRIDEVIKGEATNIVEPRVDTNPRPKLSEQLRQISDIKKIPEIESKLKEIELVAQKIEAKGKTIETYKAVLIETESWNKIVDYNKNTEPQQVVEAVKFIREISYPKPIEGIVSTETALNNIQQELITLNTDKISLKDNQNYTKLITNIVKSPVKVENTLNRLNKTAELVNPNTKNSTLQAVRGLNNLIKENPQLSSGLRALQKLTQFNQSRGNVLISLGKRFGIKSLENRGRLIAGRVGLQSAESFLLNSAKILSQRSLPEGIRLIVSGALRGGVNAELLLVKGAVGNSTIIAGLINSSGPLAPVISWGANLGSKISTIFGGFGKGAGAIKNTGLLANLGSKLGVSASKGLLKILPTLARAGGWLVKAGGALISALGSIEFAPILAMIGLVTVAVVIGIMVFTLFVSNNIISPLVPPPVEQTNCVRKGEEGTPGTKKGTANCNPNAPDAGENVGGINRKEYIRIANAHCPNPEGNVEKCFNDTVCRAKREGVDPRWALLIWYEESAGSNYNCPHSSQEVRDFGVLGEPARDYSAQIDHFMQYNFQNPCPNLDFWLGWATNYLSGGCDPDKIVGNTDGRGYLDYVQASWNMIHNSTVNVPLPSNIRTAPDPSMDCGDTDENEEGKNTYEYTDENGDVWVCTMSPNQPYPDDEVPIPDFEPWDPNTPVPEGCPHGIPSAGYFTQGPYAPGCSHQSMLSPAIDLGTGTGTKIYATHPGVAVLGYDRIYGYYIDVHGKCEGKDFSTRYAHMPEGGFRVVHGQRVEADEQIGIVNNTGSSSGPHLHYHISGLDRNKFGQYLGLSQSQTEQLWGCCGSWNGKYCPSR